MNPTTLKLVALAAVAVCSVSVNAQTSQKKPSKAPQPMITEMAEPEGEPFRPGAPGLFGARFEGWNASFVAPAGPVKLTDAILATFPGEHPTVKLEFDEKLAFRMLDLSGGSSRKKALDQALRQAGLGANISGNSFVVYAAQSATGAPLMQSPAPASPLVLTEFQPQAPVASTRAFEPALRTASTQASNSRSQAGISMANLEDAPGAIKGELRDASWFNQAPAFDAPMPAAQAIGFLFPPEHPTAQLIIENDISRKTVTWKPGLNRRQAMSSVLGQVGMTAAYANGVFRVKAASSAEPVNPMLQPSRPSASQPPVNQAGGTAAGSVPLMPQFAVQQRPQAQGGSTWTVSITDVNLANTFTRWGQEAGYKVKWDAPKHVLVGANQAFSGTFEDAIEQALDTPGIRNSAFPLEVCIYANNPPLARITRLGEQVNDCK